MLPARYGAAAFGVHGMSDRQSILSGEFARSRKRAREDESRYQIAYQGS